MDQLKAVGKAIRNSPRAIRKKFTHDGHDKLDEDWYHSQDPVDSGVNFFVKYLGSTEVTQTHGPGSTDDAVKTIVHHAKQRGAKLQKVQITISSKFVRLVDVVQQSKLDELPLYRVSYCTVDPYYDKVFCYIARNNETKKLECHAFLCSKKSKAEAITLTVAQAFNIAYERWQAQKQRSAQAKQAKAQREGSGSAGAGASAGTWDQEGIGEPLSTVQPPQATPQPPQATPQPPQATPQPPPEIQLSSDPAAAATQGLVGLNISVTPAPTSDSANPSEDQFGLNPFAAPPPVQPKKKLARRMSKDDTHISSGLLGVKSTIPKAVSLDLITVQDEFDSEFTKLAEARSNPQLLAIGAHMNRANTQAEVLQLMKGERTAEDISQTKSIDDLLLL